jgi:hypothetical protein
MRLLCAPGFRCFRAAERSAIPRIEKHETVVESTQTADMGHRHFESRRPQRLSTPRHVGHVTKFDGRHGDE